MRTLTLGAVALGAVLSTQPAQADDESKRAMIGVVSGLLGAPQTSPDQAYTAQERDRLVSLLQSGQYVTSRQGESIDTMVYGIPLTRVEHVYTARPVTPTAYRKDQ